MNGEDYYIYEEEEEEHPFSSFIFSDLQLNSAGNEDNRE
jgi:hypothetical protein